MPEIAEDEITPRLKSGERVKMTIKGEYDKSRTLGKKGLAVYEGKVYGILGAPCSLGFRCCCDALALPLDDPLLESFDSLMALLTPPPFGHGEKKLEGKR